jgi:crossover junction endodeoxyribonuclease RuvC
MNTPIRIFGVDPGTATTGYGVLDFHGGNRFDYIASGIVKTDKELVMPERLKIIRSDILDLLDQYRPHVVVVESIFFFKNAKTLVPVAQARGIILESAASRQIPVVEYNPMQVKLNLTGYGKAEKKMVQLTVAKFLEHEEIIRPDDAADAVALAICHGRAATFPTVMG